MRVLREELLHFEGFFFHLIFVVFVFVACAVVAAAVVVVAVAGSLKDADVTLLRFHVDFGGLFEEGGEVGEVFVFLSSLLF